LPNQQQCHQVNVAEQTRINVY